MVSAWISGYNAYFVGKKDAKTLDELQTNISFKMKLGCFHLTFAEV